MTRNRLQDFSSLERPKRALAPREHGTRAVSDTERKIVHDGLESWYASDEAATEIRIRVQSDLVIVFFALKDEDARETGEACVMRIAFLFSEDCVPYSKASDMWAAFRMDALCAKLGLDPEPQDADSVPRPYVDPANRKTRAHPMFTLGQDWVCRFSDVALN